MNAILKKNYHFLATTVLAFWIFLPLYAEAQYTAPDPSEYSDILSGMNGDGSENDPYEITNIQELPAMAGDLDAHYELVKDIDASDTVNWNGGAGFDPVGDNSTDDDTSRFTGVLNGRGHSIQNLSIQRPSEPYVGLFGYIGSVTEDGSGEVRFLRIEDADMLGVSHSGILSGWNTKGTAIGIWTSGVMNSQTGSGSGGVIARNNGSLSYSSSSATVSGGYVTGGLVGRNYDEILYSYATGDVSQNLKSYATGGLVGGNDGIVIQSYATGNVSGGYAIGGLSGEMINSGKIENSYALGNVTITGLRGAGFADGYDFGIITNSYSIGTVSGSGAGGFRSYLGSTTNSFWDTENSGIATSNGGTPLTTAEMYQQASYTNWDFDTIWEIDEGNGYPTLQWQENEAPILTSLSKYQEEGVVYLSGIVTDNKNPVAVVEYQEGGTSGIWELCEADDGDFDESQEPFTCNFGSPSDAEYTLYFRTLDYFGNETLAGSEPTVTFVVDFTPPTLTLDTPSSPTGDATPTITGVATDARNALASIEYQVDSTSGSWSSCTADDGTFDSDTESFSCTTQELSEGTHTIYLRSTDSADNTTQEGEESEVSIQIDLTYPSLTLNPLPTLTNEDSITLTGTTKDTDGTIASVEYQIDSTENSWTSCQATDQTFDQQEESFSCQIDNLQDGSHTIYVRATDNVGNTTQVSMDTSEQTIIDTQSPKLSLTSNVTLTTNGDSKEKIEEDASFSTRKERPELKGIYEQAKNGIISIYQRTKKGGTKKIDTTPIDEKGNWNYQLPKKENDSRYYAIKVTDQAGNESSISDWFEVIYDKTPPTFTNIPPLPNTLTAQRGTRIDFPATDEQEGLKDQSGIEKYQVKLIGYHDDWMPTPSKNDPFFIIPEGVPNGTYPMDIKVSDKAGNHTYHTITLTVVDALPAQTQSPSAQAQLQAPTQTQQTPASTNPVEPREEMQEREEIEGESQIPSRTTTTTTPESFNPEGREDDSCVFTWYNPFTWGC